MQEAVATPSTEHTPPRVADADEPTPAAAEASVVELARQTADYVRAWGSLVASEAALAKVNLVRLLVVALIVPALALAVLLSVDALLVTILHRWMEWTFAMGITLLINIGLLIGIGLLLQRWWRTLFLPRSRAALSRFLEGL